MSDVVTIGSATLYRADCRELLPRLGGGMAIVSDPPYGIGYNHSGDHGGPKWFKTEAAKRRGTPPITGDDEPFDPRWLLGLADNVLLWGADHFRARLPESGRFLAWDKLGGLEAWDSFSDVEFAWHSRTAASRIFTWKWKGLACDKRGEANGLREHPTQKPIALMAWCIEQAGRPDVICDPFMGSGTTGVAAALHGVRFVGIETEQRWFDIALRRISAAQRQPSLFSGAPA